MLVGIQVNGAAQNAIELTLLWPMLALSAILKITHSVAYASRLAWNWSTFD